jgi:hypothetical protein
VAHTRPGLGADDLGLGGGVCVKDVVLAALLVVDDELNGDPRARKVPCGRALLTIG